MITPPFSATSATWIPSSRDSESRQSTTHTSASLTRVRDARAVCCALLSFGAAAIIAMSEQLAAAVSSLGLANAINPAQWLWSDQQLAEQAKQRARRRLES